MQALLLWKNGIVVTGEPVKYIYEATVLGGSGTVSSPNYWMYLSEILLIAIANKLHLGFLFVVSVHLLLNLVATVAFYRYARSLFAPATALAGSLLLAVNYPLQQFNTFLQTESLFYSLTILLSCYVLRQTSLNIRNAAAILVLLVLVCITRPTGLLFFPVVSAYLFLKFSRGVPTGWKAGIAAASLTVFVVLLDTALRSGGELNFLLPYYEEHIICGLPTVQAAQAPGNGNSLIGLLTYIAQHFDQFLRLAAARFGAFFGLVRSYYSPAHNIYLGVLFFSTYIAALASLRYWIRNHGSELFYLAGITGLACMAAMLTCDDWHNRFYLAIHPYINLLALPFINRLVAKPIAR